MRALPFAVHSTKLFPLVASRSVPFFMACMLLGRGLPEPVVDPRSQLLVCKCKGSSPPLIACQSCPLPVAHDHWHGPLNLVRRRSHIY